MPVLINSVSANQKEFYFLLANASTITANNVNAKNISTGNLQAGYASIDSLSSIVGDIDTLYTNLISTNFVEANYISTTFLEANICEFSSIVALTGIISSISTTNIVLDGNTLDTGGAGVGAQLLLNGIPIATGSATFSTLADWSYFPAVSTLQMNNQRLSNAENIYAQNITLTQNTKTDTLTVDTSMTAGTANITNGRITNLSSTNFNTSNIFCASNITLGGNITGSRGFFSSISTQGVSTSYLSVRNNITAFGDVIGNRVAGNFMVASNVQALTKFEGGDAGVRFLTASTINVSTINGGTDYHASNWAQYPANAQVRTAGNSIYDSNNLVLVGSNNVNITASNADITLQGGLAGLASGNVNINGGDVNLNADEGIRLDLYSDINLTASNGNRGRINLTANAGYLNTNYGEINLVANGGNIGSVGYGGLITLTANTPLATPSNLTSAVKIVAASCEMYSGLASPLGSLAGFTYIYGTGGNSIVAGSPPVLPQVPGTNYMYAEFGNTIANGLYTDTIYPNFTLAGNDLTIRGRTLPVSAGVRLSNVKSIYMDSPAIISNVGCNYGSNLSYDNGGFGNLLANFCIFAEVSALGGGYNSFITGFCNITGCNMNTNSINNIAIANYLNTSNFLTASISSLTVSSINGAAPGGGGGGGGGSAINNFSTASISSLTVSSINKYISLVSDSNSQGFIVDGDAAAILLRNTNPGGQQTGLLLAADDNNALIQSFNTSNANPLNLYVFADNFGFNTSNIVGGIEFQIEGNTLVNNGSITCSNAGVQSGLSSSNLSIQYINNTRQQILADIYSSNSTTVSGANTPTAIYLDTLAVANGISLVFPGFVVDYTGLYKLNVSIQLDKSGGGTDPCDFWIKVNGNDVANSASQITVQGTQGECLANCSYFLSLIANDKVELWFASPEPTMTATSFPAWTTPTDPYDRPAIPAVIANIQLIK